MRLRAGDVTQRATEHATTSGNTSKSVYVDHAPDTVRGGVPEGPREPRQLSCLR